MDPQGKLVYMNHLHKITTYEKPKSDIPPSKNEEESPEYSDQEKKDVAPAITTTVFSS
jgi:hypothetical protein